MIFGAPQMERWDPCRRKWAYLEDWQLRRVRPIGAVYNALHEVLQAQEYPGPKLARDSVMQQAGERGVWTDRNDPYDMMVHHAHLAEVLARVLRQPSDGPREKHKGMAVARSMLSAVVKHNVWQPEAYLIDGGLRLMRFVLVDHWDDDRQSAELHSWRTIGDVCVTGLPMTIRVAVIGQSRGGRRLGHWTRARRHPMNKGLRFARKQGKGDGFTGSWEWVWRENSQVNAQAWLEQMNRDGVLVESAFNVQVKVPGEWQRQKVLEDIERIGGEMQMSGSGVPDIEATNKHPDRDRGITIYKQFPMTRSACDDPLRGPCPLQCVCYAPREITPGETGLFVRRKR